MESDPLPIQKVDLSQADLQHLVKLRARKPARSARLPRPTKGDRVADIVTSTVGSWRFIIIQSGLLALWIVLNVLAWVHHWDPYPFILLNLALSFQAAYATPLFYSDEQPTSLDYLYLATT